MASLFIRMLIAAVMVVLLFLALPAFLHILGVTMNGDLITIMRVCVAAVALWYVFFGPKPSLPSPPA